MIRTILGQNQSFVSNMRHSLKILSHFLLAAGYSGPVGSSEQSRARQSEALGESKRGFGREQRSYAAKKRAKVAMMAPRNRSKKMVAKTLRLKILEQRVRRASIAISFEGRTC